MWNGSMALSACSRCLSVDVKAATATIRRETVVQRRELSVRPCWPQDPACFSKGSAATGSHQPSKHAPHGLAVLVRCHGILGQALLSDSGSVSDPIGTADDAGQPVDSPVQPAAGVDWRELLWKALHSDSGPGQFACSGRIDQASLYPDITLAGVGRLTLPLSSDQGLALKSVAEQAPHGRGLETLVDTAVRDAYQVDASKVTVAPSWQPTLQSIVSEVAEALDLYGTPDCKLDARLYKILLYEKGGHFVAHQDTEKEPGMLATLVVQLPCCEGHTGGELSIWHRGNKLNHCFAEASATSLQYAAFFADCEHELRPITRGMRLALVYNLVWVGAPADLPQSSRNSPASTLSPKGWRAGKLQRAVQAWEESITAGCEQTRIAFMLDHQYTRWNLSFKQLKGRDRSKWRKLVASEGLETHLALVTRRIHGYDGCGDDNPHFTPQFDSDNEDDLDPDYEDNNVILQLRAKEDAKLDPEKWEDVYQDLITAEKWVAQDGSNVDYGNINQQELYNPDSTKRLFPRRYLEDHEEHHNYLGNDGASTIQIYKRAALVLWPRSQTLVNAKKAGFRTLLPLLKHSLRKAGSGASDERVFAASVLEACVQRLDTELPKEWLECDEDAEDFEEEDLDSSDNESSFYYNYMNGDCTESDLQDCTLTVLELSLQAVKSGIPTAAEMLQRVATAVEKRPGNYSLLKKLLQCSEVQAALSLPAVQQLVSCQIANLEPMSWIQPFSWHMPEAEASTWKLFCKDKAVVDEFLQGPEETLTLSGYGSLREAERTAAIMQGTYRKLPCHTELLLSINDPNYSFTALAKAESFGACIVITKTKDWYMRQVEAKKLFKEELEGVRAMRRVTYDEK